MDARMAQEIALLQKFYPGAQYREEGRWFWIPEYPVPSHDPAWNRTVTQVCFQASIGHPGSPPYGFFVPVGLRIGDTDPQNYQPKPGIKPPFPDEWGFFSWQTVEGHWRPTADLVSGANLLNFARTFADRFREGA